MPGGALRKSVEFTTILQIYAFEELLSTNLTTMAPELRLRGHIANGGKWIPPLNGTPKREEAKTLAARVLCN